MSDHRDPTSERGASLVEFALIAPVLFVIVFGIIDFSWILAQHQDVRHGAREGARLAAVDWGTHDQIVQETCERTTSLANGDTTVTIVLNDVTGGDDNSDGRSDNDAGDSVQVTVDYPADSLTGFFSVFLGGINLSSTVEMRLEQDAGFVETATAGAFTCA